MAHIICVRDVVRAELHELPPDVLALRVPYDLFKPAGPVVLSGDRIQWGQDRQSHSMRFAEAILGECTPGERVLIHLSPTEPRDQWWLCEVESVDDVEGPS